MIELGYNILAKPPRLAIRVSNLGIANNGKPIPQQSPYGRDSQRFIFPNGVTTLTNAELFDHQRGRGLVADAWRPNPEYVIGTKIKPNDCYDLVERVLAKINLPLNLNTFLLFNNSQEYYTYYSQRLFQRVEDVASIEQWPSKDEPKSDVVQTRVFDVVGDPEDPRLIAESTSVRRRMPDGARRVYHYRVICGNATSLSDDCWYTGSVS